MSERIKKFFERAAFTTADFSTGGAMPDDHLAAFVQVMRNRSKLLGMTRVEIMRSATKTLDRINLPERSLYNAGEMTGATTNTTKPVFAKRTLTATKASMAMDWSSETIEDSIEGGNLEQTLLDMLAQNYANQTVDLGVNGDGATPGFLALNTGWLVIAKALAVAGDSARVNTTGLTDYVDILERLYAAVPAKFKDAGMPEEGWAILLDPASEEAYRKAVRARNSNLGDQALIDGRYIPFSGLPLIPCGYFPAKTILLTPPKNLAYGIHREPKINIWYDNDKDGVQARVHGRIDFEVVDPGLIVIGYDY